MTNKSFFLTNSFYQYILDNSLREPELLRQLREETYELDVAGMQIAPEQGQFMQLLVRLSGAVNALEIGVFTGYSSLSVAMALPPEGKLVACDVSEEWTSIARRFWKKGGVEDKVSLRLAPAVETLDKLLAEGRQESFDFAFIDADKESYEAYYERTLELMRPRGIILLDNMFRSGRVADPSVSDSSVQAIRDLSKKLHYDDRIELSLLPLADGVALALKK